MEISVDQKFVNRKDKDFFYVAVEIKELKYKS